MAHFGQFFGHNFFIWNLIDLIFSPLFLEYLSAILRIFSDFFEQNNFLTLYSKNQNFKLAYWEGKIKKIKKQQLFILIYI